MGQSKGLSASGFDDFIAPCFLLRVVTGKGSVPVKKIALYIILPHFLWA